MEWSKGRAALYICDDAITFCEPRFIELKGGASPIPPNSQPKASGALRRNSHGFIENNLDAALALARKEKKLVLADFSARWCPGCVRLETETFNTARFRKLAS